MWARALLRGATDFVYPPACRLCDGELPESPAEGIGPVFCAQCEAALLADRGTACVRCGATIGPGLDPKLPCAFCHDESYTFERTVRLGVYDGPLRAACLAIKKPGSESLAAALAELTWQLEKDVFAGAGIDVVIPIPQFWMQRFTRGHHAADTLAEAWARRLQVPLASHILRKVRWTRPQARLTPSERRVNLRRAFATVGVDALAGASVLLADDVMTTGTTVQEATRQLRQAGAARVVVAVVARGLGRQVSHGSRS
ncbi:MAG TPA: phosphoribosyltransferase family protein [Planctomycetaceae bacterium]|nr:phosphoribosyltransferase family protein [Planctomycetaceae bacterium]